MPKAPTVALPASSLSGPFHLRIDDDHMQSAADSVIAAQIIPLERDQPPDPVEAADKNIAGFVHVEFVVQADGRVRDAALIDAQPTGTFDAVVIATVLKWKFRPRIRDGRAVEWRAPQKILFTPLS